MENFSVKLTPRFYETDAMGHINNATIAAWFEVVRVAYIDELCGGSESMARSWILASVHIDFKGETFYGSEVDARIVGASIGNTSMTVHCQMWQDGRLTVTGQAVVVHIDFDSRTPQRIPDSMREKVKLPQT